MKKNSRILNALSCFFKKRIIILGIVLFWTSPVFPGSAPANGTSFHDPETIIRFSKKLEKTLAARGARVAIISRVGRPRTDLPDGVLYTHTAFAVYSKIQTAEGKILSGYAIHNLYQREKEPDKSDLKQDYPIDFISGSYLLETGIIIPKPELQKRLLTVITSENYRKLHNSKYSLLANPFNSDFQNCTEFVLDVITAAIYQTNSIRQIKANERAYFKPLAVDISPVKLLLGAMFMSDVKTSDHKGSPKVATFTTIRAFLEKFDAVSEVITLTDQSI